MNSLKGSGGEHMKFLTFGTPLNKMKHPNITLIMLFHLSAKMWNAVKSIMVLQVFHEGAFINYVESILWDF